MLHKKKPAHHFTGWSSKQAVQMQRPTETHGILLHFKNPHRQKHILHNLSLQFPLYPMVHK